MAKMTITIEIDDGGFKNIKQEIKWESAQVIELATYNNYRVKEKDIMDVFESVANSLPEKVEESILYSATAEYGKIIKN